MNERSPHRAAPPPATWPHIPGAEPWPVGPTGRLLGRRPPWLLGVVVAVVALGGVVTVLDVLPPRTMTTTFNLLNAFGAIALSVALGTVVFRFAGRACPVWALILLAQSLSSLALVVVEVVDATRTSGPSIGAAAAFAAGAALPTSRLRAMNAVRPATRSAPTRRMILRLSMTYVAFQARRS